MIYATCPTCGFLIASVAEKYEKEKEKICQNPDYSKEKQEEEIQKLIQNIGLRRYCCRMRLFTCLDIVQDIVPINNDI